MGENRNVFEKASLAAWTVRLVFGAGREQRLSGAFSLGGSYTHSDSFLGTGGLAAGRREAEAVASTDLSREGLP